MHKIESIIVQYSSIGSVYINKGKFNQTKIVNFFRMAQIEVVYIMYVPLQLDF